MEGFSVKSVAATTIPSFDCRGGLFIDKPARGNVLQAFQFPYPKKLQLSRKLKFLPYIAHSTGTTRSSLETVGVSPNKAIAKDENLVFVAGSTGRVGSRTVRELLKLGFHVRAGVRSAQKADTLVQSVKQMKLDSGSGSEGIQPLEKLEIVECDLEKPEQIASALGNASIVICCIGASEKEIFDITGPCRIDYRATKNLIDAATVAKVNQFILLTSLGTNKFGLPAAILNLFWGVLIWKRKAEEALIASGLPYTIVRPGGMERPTDAYKDTHNITLSTEDTLFGGQVSNLQVAELMAVMARNRGLSFCKVVEVIAETTAPLIPMEELLAKIPSQRPFTQSIEVPVSADIVKPEASTSDVSVPTSTTKEKSEPQKTVPKQPLSPYTVYDNLKPPSSPSPSPPVTSSPILGVAPQKLEGSSAETDVPSSSLAIDSPESSIHYHSPYHAYEDLKPPSSPSPSQPVTSSTTSGFAPKELEGGSSENSTPSGSLVAKDYSESSKHYHSPYHAYADFKPPTSPSPEAPAISSSSSVVAGSTLASLSGNGTTPQPVSDSSDQGENQTTAKSTVHSPFTMYEDMKPPTSPAPSKS